MCLSVVIAQFEMMDTNQKTLFKASFFASESSASFDDGGLVAKQRNSFRAAWQYFNIVHAIDLGDV